MREVKEEYDQRLTTIRLVQLHACLQIEEDHHQKKHNIEKRIEIFPINRLVQQIQLTYAALSTINTLLIPVGWGSTPSMVASIKHTGTEIVIHSSHLHEDGMA